MSNSEAVIQKPFHAGETRSFWPIFLLGFVVFLVVALTGQLLGWHWRTRLPGAEGVESVFGGVKAAVYTFMSHLT